MVAPSMTSSARPNNILKLVFFIINIIMTILSLGLDTSTIRGTLLQIQRGDASSLWYGGWSAGEDLEVCQYEHKHTKI
jgi:hypothetical protein